MDKNVPPTSGETPQMSPESPFTTLIEYWTEHGERSDGEVVGQSVTGRTVTN
jgi:hypothetical protein